MNTILLLDTSVGSENKGDDIIMECIHEELKMSTVSVIVPVYNAEGVVSRGIDSILAQSYLDFELILVDDGSTDNSGAICDNYAQQDGRVKVIHQDNAGVSAARNAGLKVAQGEWVTFVDSDDLVLDGFLESLVTAVSSDERIDLAYCGYAIVEGSTSIKTYQTATYLGKEQLHDVLSSTNLLYRCSPWAKLFRRSIIIDNGLQFDTNLTISEDRLFLYQYLIHVRGVATTSTVGYLYGSFSPTSLKHKRVPTEMLAYRQKAITAAAHDVVKEFGLMKGEAFLITRHLMLILFELIRNVYQDSGSSRKTRERQRELFIGLFAVELYQDNLVNDPRWIAYLKQNRLMDDMVNVRFRKLNRKLYCGEMNLSIRLLAYNLLKKRWTKPSSVSFDKSITLINGKMK